MKIKKIINGFMTPRFTTEELEKSKTRSGAEFEIATLIFDDKREHFPTRVLGRATNSLGVKIIVIWNQYGECIKDGGRLPEFDLVHPNQKNIDAAKPVFAGMLGLILFIIITILWN